ncbi:hypothetical protein M899_2152 [Bacteriovorax sp. BSW11_IV]|uniref:hypothetical protein n=1 Tax=Bacteriovorax sp. BSW11_IV TaxID=1353529 RepID=UPI00038A1C4E|nr:hypothetical protein [Bacteriovorax sp. BSW11_IV]EQC47839.1 hypothetical protein M899_2152 [Bacteriovorax sp. BSW11_IV]
MKKILIALSFIIQFQPALAEKFTLGSDVINLPIEKSWLAKQSDNKGSLVFFNPKEKNPRPITSLYFAKVLYPTQDVSTFKDEFIKEKIKWIEEVGAKSNKAVKADEIDQHREILIEAEFNFQNNDFIEITRMRECSKTKTIILKMLFPKNLLKTEQKQFDELKEVNFCPEVL